MKKYFFVFAVASCFLFVCAQKGFANQNVDAAGCMVSGCHTTAALHAVTTHASNCAQCHTTSSGGGTVASSRCIVCHPQAGDPGQCNLIKTSNHANAGCTTCHTDCKSTCPAAKVLGDDDPRLVTLRQFRDKVLAKSALGKRIITIYYNNENSVNAALEKNPKLKAFSYKALQSFIPVAEIFM